jgi:hypothetical protein
VFWFCSELMFERGADVCGMFESGAVAGGEAGVVGGVVQQCVEAVFGGCGFGAGQFLAVCGHDMIVSLVCPPAFYRRQILVCVWSGLLWTGCCCCSVRRMVDFAGGVGRE